MMDPTTTAVPVIMLLTAGLAESLTVVWPWAKPSKSRHLIPVLAVILATAMKVALDLLVSDAWTWEGFGMGVLMGVLTVAMHWVQKSKSENADGGSGELEPPVVTVSDGGR